MAKYYISTDELRERSYELAARVVADNYVPDIMVALWRGGAVVGCYMHEAFKLAGWDVDHIPIKTSKYSGVGVAKSEVEVHDLNYIMKIAQTDMKILIVDDVVDSGHTLETVTSKLDMGLADREIGRWTIRSASPYYKSKRNKSKFKHDYWLVDTDDWIVFPHELEDMTIEEIRAAYGDKIANILAPLVLIRQKKA